MPIAIGVPIGYSMRAGDNVSGAKGQGVADTEVVERFVPEFLYLHCDNCLRYCRVEDITQERKGLVRIIHSTCTRCKGEVTQRIETAAQLREIAERAIKYHLRSLQRNERKNSMATKTKAAVKATSNKKAAAADDDDDDDDEDEVVTTKAKSKGKNAKASTVKGKTKAVKATKKVSADREKKYERPEGGPSHLQAVMLAFAGDMYTLEQANERMARLATKKITGERTVPLTTSDATYHMKSEIKMPDDKEHQLYVAKDKNGVELYGVPTYADPLKKNATAGKVSKGAFNGLKLATDRKALTK